MSLVKLGWKRNWIILRSQEVVDPYVLCPHTDLRLASQRLQVKKSFQLTRQDPEDNVFIESMDWSTIKPDADVGAVLCGFDAYVSKSPFDIILSSARSGRRADR